MAKTKKYTHQPQTISPSCKKIKYKKYDPIKHFHRDPSGVYVLIRINKSKKRIELAVCNKSHEIVSVFEGRTCQDVYYALFQYEKRYKKNWFRDKAHIAYIGKELKKAELALKYKSKTYYQE